MKIFLHGLGQGPDAWDKPLSALGTEDPCLCPDLPGLLRGQEASYANLYAAFSALCHSTEGTADLCGLSLGAVLALHYTIEHPQKVRSLVLIAPQFKMPKALLRFQNALFHLMPNSMFRQAGFGKAEFLQLCRTMLPLDFSHSVKQIACPTLLLCGEKDTANRKSAVLLAGLLQNARFQTVPGAGHECNTEAPEKLAELLGRFWSER